jgi:recombination protein RecA
VHELLDLGADRGLVEKSGAWFSVGGERLGPGREKAAEALRGNGALAASLEKGLREVVAAKPMAVQPTQVEAAA